MLSKTPKRSFVGQQAGPLLLLLVGIVVLPLDHPIATHIVLVSLFILTHRMSRKN